MNRLVICIDRRSIWTESELVIPQPSSRRSHFFKDVNNFRRDSHHRNTVKVYVKERETITSLGFPLSCLSTHPPVDSDWTLRSHQKGHSLWDVWLSQQLRLIDCWQTCTEQTWVWYTWCLRRSGSVPQSIVDIGHARLGLTEIGKRLKRGSYICVLRTTFKLHGVQPCWGRKNLRDELWRSPFLQAVVQSEISKIWCSGFGGEKKK